MDLSKIGFIKAKVIEWDGSKEVNINDETGKTLLALFVSQTYPVLSMYLDAMDKVMGHKVTAEEVEGATAALIYKSDRRISLHYFNNHTVGISKQFRESGRKLIREAKECRQ